MTLEDALRQFVLEGALRLTIWPCDQGFQANVSRDGKGWIVGIDRDPVIAVQKAFQTKEPAAPPALSGGLFD